MKAVYALYHRMCGHVGGVGNDRATLEAQAQAHAETGFHGWRVRVATEADIESVLADDKCSTCSLYGSDQNPGKAGKGSAWNDAMSDSPTPTGLPEGVEDR